MPRQHRTMRAEALPSQRFWNGKSVLLTGHTGFKGAWLGLWLRRLGARVTGYSLAPETSPSLSAALENGGVDESMFGDIRDAERLARAFDKARPDFVLHLAAQALVRRSYVAPIETMETNVMGVARVLEACRGCPSARSIVVVTTDKCYENREWVWAYREDEALGGHDPYSASKACAEIVANAWRRSFLGADPSGPRALATARAGNVIGGGDWSEDQLLPDCARALAAGRPVGVRQPGATRPWQHVLEPLRGYLLLAERLHGSEAVAFAEAWNFGPDASDVAPVLAVVQHAVSSWGPDARYDVIGSDRRHEANFLAVDAAKARARLNWRPWLDLGTAIDWTMDWYRRFYAGEKAGSLVEEQIARYEALSECVDG